MLSAILPGQSAREMLVGRVCEALAGHADAGRIHLSLSIQPLRSYKPELSVHTCSEMPGGEEHSSQSGSAWSGAGL